MEAGEIKIAVDDLEIREVLLSPTREFVVKHSDGKTARIYRFSAEAIPAGARILSATLCLPAQLLKEGVKDV